MWISRKGRGALAVSTVTSTALTVATTWAAQTSGKRLFARSRLDLGTGKAAVAAAILGWDFLYYWNHRASHESRWLWAVHVAHHSSERYNLSTALRQPVAEGVTLTVPVRDPRPARRPAGPDRARTRGQPDLPVLDPHRDDPPARPAGAGAQHPVAPPGAPRLQPPVPRPQPRQHPDHLGPAVRHLRGGGRGRRLRPDPQHQDLQPAADRLARVARHRPRHRRRRDLVGALVLRAARPRLGLRRAAPPPSVPPERPRGARPSAAQRRRAAPRRRRGRATGSRARRERARPRRSPCVSSTNASSSRSRPSSPATCWKNRSSGFAAPSSQE